MNQFGRISRRIVNKAKPVFPNISTNNSYKSVKYMSACSKSCEESMNNPDFQWQSALRAAQATESFRSAFLRTSGSNSSISQDDINYLVADRRIRPSLLLNVYSGAGAIVGICSKATQIVLGKEIERIVETASKTQFNDCIRNLQEASNNDEEIKETLKYHRDVFSAADTTESNAAVNTAAMLLKTAFNISLKY